ncbi:MAG: Ig-like domain-containing protein [Bacteroidota bacterium]
MFGHLSSLGISFLRAAAVVVLLASCASQRPPEGGPADTEPPTILETVPSNETVRFSGQEVEIEFSEYVQRQSFQEAVHISPLLDEPPTYEWSGRRVTIVFPAPLLANRTYVITVGTKVKDLRAGNAMKETMHLAFSTGDSLDIGSFNGTVFGDPPTGIGVFAYELFEGRADTLDPADDRPDYAVQSSDNGEFHFYNVAPGSYRVYAVRDKSNDMRYNAETDEIGIPDHDMLVTDSLSSSPPLRFYMNMEDTTRPSVQRVEALTERIVRVKFNETVYPQPLPLEHIVILDSSSGRRISVISAVPPASERFAWDFLLGETMVEAKYLLSIDSLKDGAGNFIDAAEDSLIFIGSTLPDTLSPILVSRNPEANAKKVEPDSSFRFESDRPLILGEAFSLKDSSDINVPLQILRTSSTEFILSHPSLLPEAIYTLCLDMRLLQDSLNSRSIGDSTECTRFTTGSSDQTGTLSGTVRSADSVSTAVVRIREVSRTPKTRSLRTDASRNFSADGLKEGNYLIDAFIDKNANNRYDFGKAFPWTKPEPYGAVRDTMRVRARWDTKGIIIPIQSASSP